MSAILDTALDEVCPMSIRAALVRYGDAMMAAGREQAKLGHTTSDHDSRCAMEMLAVMLTMRKELSAAGQKCAKDVARYQKLRGGQRWAVIDGRGLELLGVALDESLDAAIRFEGQA